MKRTLVFAAFVFSAGILIAIAGVSVPEIVLHAVFLLIVVNISLAMKGLRFSALSFFTAFLFVAGAADFHFSGIQSGNPLKGIREDQRMTLYGVIDGEPEKRGDSLKFPLECRGFCVWSGGYNCMDKDFGIEVFAGLSEQFYAEGDFVAASGYVVFRTDIPGKSPFFFKAGGIIKIDNLSGNGLKKRLAGFRARVDGMLSGKKDKDAASLYSAMVLGERSGISDAANDAFKKTGTTHLLSISGLHIAVFILMVFFLFKALFSRFHTIHLFVPEQISAGIASIAVGALYVVFTGSKIPTVRAMLMAAAFLSAPLFRRFHDAWSSIAFAWLVIVLFNPDDMLSPSFVLSFSAVIAIVKFHPMINCRIQEMIKTKRRVISKILSYSASVFACSLAAYIGTTPPLLMFFDSFSLSSVFVNVLAVPFASFVLLPLGLMITALYAVNPELSSAFADHAIRAARFFIVAVDFFSSYSTFNLMPLNSPAGIAITALCLLAVLFMTVGFSLRSYILAAALTVSCAAAAGFIQKKSGDELEVTFIDVRHGDSILIEFPGGKTALIDAGGSHDQKVDTGRTKVMPALAKKGISSLDYLMLTHPHPDHVNGMFYIARAMAVKNFILPAKFRDNNAAAMLIQTVTQKGGAVHYIGEDGQSLDFKGAQVRIFAYDVEETGETDSDINNGSLIVLIKHGANGFLLCGDLEEEGEERLINDPQIEKITVFKANHHGSLTSNGENFLNKISPEYVVFSSYSRGSIVLPKAEIVERALSVNAALLATELYGDIAFASDGAGLSIRSTRKPEPLDITAFLSRLKE
ncbi:MAG: DNA internalization-related competence protein ComEC/Rec2 [Deltaproteobacteria bacterium]|nr:DNA internalization-related competence protein ComEC/Rec2 [Deltaproteobacteria bacterium]